jgi:hypothetical protein
VTSSMFIARRKPLSPRSVVVEAGDLGMSVFAAKTFEPGDTVLSFQGPIISFAQAVAKGDYESYALQIGPNSYLDLLAPSCYFNHSCEPNTGIIRGRHLVAVRRIVVGEEIRYDYSTTMDEDHWTMDCRCGSRRCRETIRDFKYLPLDLQREYLNNGLVQPFIALRMRWISANVIDTYSPHLRIDVLGFSDQHHPSQ